MKTYVLRLNPDTRSGEPYSAYPSRTDYRAIHKSSPMDGFHEAVNFLPEQGIVRGYLPPRHLTAIRTGEPFALVVITAKTAKVGGDQLIGFQVGCIYDGEHLRNGVPKESRSLKLTWHFTCPESLSFLLPTPIADARNLVVGKQSNWVRGSTHDISKPRFLRLLQTAYEQTKSSKCKKSLDLLRAAFEESRLPLEIAEFEDVAFANAVADALSLKQKSVPGNPRPHQRRVISYQYVRDAKVVAYALQRAKGFCGDCGEKAPFISNRTGLPYLEVHHKTTLNNQGSDTTDNVIALCPNCHRRRHFGQSDA